MALPTLVDLKVHLDIPADDTSNDDELTDILDAAIDVVENIVGPLTTGPVTETHYGVSSPLIVLRQVPAVELTAVAVRLWGTLAADQDVAGYTLDPSTGVLRTATGYQLRGDVTVTYTVGFSTVPAAVRLGTLIVAAQLWETQRGAMPLQPAGTTDDTAAVNVGYAPAIPSRAKTLLEPFARGPGVA